MNGGRNSDRQLALDPRGGVLCEFGSVAEAAGVGLRGRFGDQVVRTDYRLLSRILRNFISNAIRYTERGGVLVGCRTRGSEVSN